MACFPYVLLMLLLSSCSQGSLKTEGNINAFLRNNHFNYSIDEEGDYRINADGTRLHKDVWIRGHVNYSGKIGIREIFSLSAPLNKKELNILASVLLADNRQTRIIGNWALAGDETQGIVMYIIKAPLHANNDFILQSITEASQASWVLEKVLLPEE